MRRRALLLAYCLLLSAGGTLAAPVAKSAAAADGAEAVDCPSVYVLGSRGSGDKLGKDEGLSAPGRAFATRVEKLLRGAGTVETWANPYAAVGVFSWNLRKLVPELLNSAGAVTKLSGLGLGAYHDSVAEGSRLLAAKVASVVVQCGRRTALVLVGYSQGAQVAADAYQRRLGDRQRRAVAAVILFGDPYFDGGDRAVDRGSFSGRRDGILGRRPRFRPTGKTLVLSYCHSHDPICQSLFFRLGPTRTLDPGSLTFRQHTDYTRFGEPERAAALVAKAVHPPATPAASRWPTGRDDGPPALFIWLGASFLTPSWSSCDATYCLVGVDSQRRVYVFEIDRGIDELGWLPASADPRAALLRAHLSEANVNALLAPSR